MDPGWIIAPRTTSESAHGRTAGEVTIDRLVEPHKAQGPRRQGPQAAGAVPPRRARRGPRLVREFVESCRSAGLISIIEPVSRKSLAAATLTRTPELPLPRNSAAWAPTLQGRGPFKGQASEAEVRAACAELTKAIDGPWVVLSSGVPEDVF